MSRYTKEHYEDVARILSKDARTVEIVTEDIARDFADLFAADNPARCICGDSKGAMPPCAYPALEHLFEGGFDRERFLAACGLKQVQQT